MSNKTTKNYIYNLIYQVLLVISPVITMPFLSRSLGASGIGQYSYAYAITNVFALIATLGCDIYGRREISYVKDSIKEKSIKFWSIQVIKIVCTLLIMISYFIFSNFNKDKVILIILSFHLINVPLNIGWFYQGIEKFKNITIRGFVLKIAELLFVIFCIKEPSDLTLYVFGSSFINFLAFFVLWIGLKKELTKVSIKELTIKRDLKNCIVFFLPSIATSIYTLMDKTMLGIISGSYLENGYYEQAQKINIILLKLVLALGTVLLPQIAAAFKKKDFDLININITKSIRYVFFISIPIAIGLICISDLFVPWFFGDGFEKVSILLKISGFIIIFQGVSDVFGMQYLVSVGRQNDYIISLLGGAFVNFVCNFILIPELYSIGAIIASLIGEIAIVIIQILFIKKDLKIGKLLKQCKNYVVCSICILLVIPITKQMSPTIINTIIIGIAGGGLYISALILLKDEMLKNTLRTLKAKLTKDKMNT